MNKQEAIKEMGKIDGLTIKDKSVGFYIKMIPEVEILKIIKQIDEPEKHVVPQYVAEYIEYCKHEKFYALHGAYANMDDRLKCWRFNGNNSELFAKAWLYGYEVEKEKLYTVELPNPNSDGYGIVYLGRNEDNKIELHIWNHFSSIEFSNDWKQFDNAQLTEDEIRKDYEWAWQFAKEVEE